METRYSIIHPGIGNASSKIEYDDGILGIRCFGREGELLASVRFDSVLLVRVTDEAGRLQLLTQLAGRHGFVMVDNESLLIQWIGDESMGTRDLGRAKHYVILSGEEVIDVVSFDQPSITTEILM